MVLVVLAWVLLVPTALAAGWLLLGGLTASGVAYVLAPVIALAGLGLRKKRVAWAGVALFAATLIVRLVGAGAGNQLEMRGGSFLARVVDEGDLAITASRAIVITGFLPGGDTRTLVPDMQRAYVRMHASEGSFPSPVADTYLRDDGGTMEIDPPGVASPKRAVVFLHGFAGSFSIPCWQVAQTARRVDAITVCPATHWRGDWWSRDGERTLRATLDDLHARGVHDVTLVGLSNGGLGASRLVTRFPAGTFRGLVLISGADATAAPPGVPTLVVQGSEDGMMPTAIARGYAARAHAKLVLLAGGTHFVMIERPETCERAIGDFLARDVNAQAESG